MKRYLSTLAIVALVLMTLTVPAVQAADARLGIFVHPWTDYPSDLLNFDTQVRATVGPVLSFSSGFVTSSFWYGLDPNRTGTLCTLDGFGVTGESLTTLSTRTEELGWRLMTSGNLFLSASVSRLRWQARTACDGELTSSLSSTMVAAGGGFRVNPLWGAFEGGVRWTEASEDFIDVGKAPETFVMLAAGADLRLNPISDRQIRHTVPSLQLAFEEDFPLGCVDWEWSGQTGQISVIDEQLGITVKEPNQHIVQPLGIELPRYVVDLDVITRSSSDPEHSFGLVVRYLDSETFYCVEVRTDGYVRLAQMVKGEYSGVTPWRQTTALRSGTRNALRVVVPGNRVIVYLNGVRVLRAEEVSFVSGEIGLLAHSYDAPGTWVAFDDIEIRELEQGMTLDPRTNAAREIETIQRVAASVLSGIGAFIAAQEGWDTLSYGLIGFSMLDLLYPSMHVIEVK